MVTAFRHSPHQTLLKSIRLVSAGRPCHNSNASFSILLFSVLKQCIFECSECSECSGGVTASATLNLTDLPPISGRLVEMEKQNIADALSNPLTSKSFPVGHRVHRCLHPYNFYFLLHCLEVFVCCHQFAFAQFGQGLGDRIEVGEPVDRLINSGLLCQFPIDRNNVDRQSLQKLQDIFSLW